jgi:hypothetical protein
MSARRQQARLGEMEGAGRGDSDSHMIAAGSEASGGDSSSSSSSSRGGKAALATAPPENWSVVYVDISGLSGRCDTTRQDKTTAFVSTFPVCVCPEPVLAKIQSSCFR